MKTLRPKWKKADRTVQIASASLFQPSFAFSRFAPSSQRGQRREYHIHQPNGSQHRQRNCRRTRGTAFPPQRMGSPSITGADSPGGRGGRRCRLIQELRSWLRMVLLLKTKKSR